MIRSRVFNVGLLGDGPGRISHRLLPDTEELADQVGGSSEGALIVCPQDYDVEMEP
jgi:hypothetical protein